jgi:hypothetical protein
MFRQRNRNVTWVRAGQGGRPRRTRSADLLERSVPGGIDGRHLFDLERALEEVGLPSIPGTTPAEELRELLRAAAEIEHGLMAQYLYATFSSTNAPITSSIRGIAIEEMGHLVTVENLLLAAGSPPYLGRYDHSPNDFDPFPFHLEPVSRGVLAKYAACEMPTLEDVDPEEQDVLPELLADAAAAAGTIAPHRIGLLYTKIYWLLRPSDAPPADPSGEPWEGYPVAMVAQIEPGRHVGQYPPPGPLPPQATEDDWQSGNPSVLVCPVGSRAEAMLAVARVAAQGEGFASEADAHFDRFVAAYRQAVVAGSIGRPFATDPWYVGAGAASGAPEAEITAPRAIEFARLGDVIYETLLLTIGLTLHPDNGFGADRRSRLAGLCIDLMRRSLRSLARAFPRLRIRDDATSPELSPCLTLPPDQDGPAAMRARLAVQIAAGITLASSLEAATDLHVTLRSAATATREVLEALQAEGTDA